MRCPQCDASFDEGTGELLGHLTFLQDRITCWRSDGAVQPATADRLAELTAREIAALAEAARPEPVLATAAALIEADIPGASGAALTPPPPPLRGANTGYADPLRESGGHTRELRLSPSPAHTPGVQGESGGEGAQWLGAGGEGLLGREGVGAPTSDDRYEYEVDGGPWAPQPAPVAGPSFAWRDIGHYLLSERTLHGLLGLGAFLILASGVVISTLNPTHLGPLAHLAAVVTTTLLFFAAGLLVRQKLGLTIAGTTLLGIAGAFVPLTIWTLGQEQLLDWDTRTIWLVASCVGLPLYLVVQRLLHDRTFAILSALAGGSTLLAALTRADVPLTWGCVGLLLLALGYVRLGERLARTGDPLGWALLLSARIVTPLLLAVLCFASLVPWHWRTVFGVPLGRWPEHASTAGLWLGVLFYAQAAELLGRRHAYVAAGLTLLAIGSTIGLLDVPAAWSPLAWTGSAGLLLLAGEFAVRRTGEGERPHLQTALGYGPWRSRLGPPLLLAGYAAAAIALFLVTVSWLNAATGRNLGRMAVPATLGFWAVLATLGASAVARRSPGLLYPLALLAALPWLSSANHLADWLGIVPTPAGLPRVLLALSTVELLAAWTLDRRYGRYALPFAFGGYVVLGAALSAATVDRWAAIQVVGGAVALLGCTAALIHVRWLPTLAGAVDGLSVGRSTTDSRPRVSETLFQALAAWLFVPWALLVTSLREPPTIVYAYILGGLGIAYVAVGYGIRQVRLAYRWPWYLGGYALSVVAPVVAFPDATWRPGVLALSIGLYCASAAVSRRSGWLYAVALLTPVLMVQSLERTPWFWRWISIELVALGIAYGAVGLALHLLGKPADERRQIGWRSGWRIEGRIGPFAQPFVGGGYVLSALGVALAATQQPSVATLALGLGALHCAVSALVLRQPIFGALTAALSAAAYVVSLTLLPLDRHWQAVCWLAFGAVSLLVAEGLRRVTEPARRLRGAAWTWPWTWPWTVAVLVVAAASPAFAQGDRQSLMLAWWGSTLLLGCLTVQLRHPLALGLTLLAGGMAFLTTGSVVFPAVTPAQSFASLTILAWIYLGAAWVVERRLGRQAVAGAADGGADGSSSVQAKASRMRRFRVLSWAAPLHLVGWLALALACLGSLDDPQAGLAAGFAASVLLVILTIMTDRPGYAWASVATLSVSLGQGLRLADVPSHMYAPSWALAGLGAMLLSQAAATTWLPRLRIWVRPLRVSAVLLAVGAVTVALGMLTIFGTVRQVHALALTTALAGVTAIGLASSLRDRRPAYLGIGLLVSGLLLELLAYRIGQPQAFALPVGAYLLGIAFVEWRRGTAKSIKRPIELTGLTVLLGLSLIQSVGLMGDGLDWTVYATFLLVESVGLLALGAALRWRNTFLAGAIALILDICILAVDPLRALNTWYLVALIGLTLIGVVIWIERKRQQIPQWLAAWSARLEAWD